MKADEKSLHNAGVKAPHELLQAQALANTLDYAVRLPLIGIRVGLDSLIGLIPVVGDAIMLLVSMRILYLAKKMKMPKPLLVMMLRNCLIDFGLGFIPVIGDIIDIFFKANLRNVRIMERFWVSQHKSMIDAEARRQLQDWERQIENEGRH